MVPSPRPKAAPVVQRRFTHKAVFVLPLFGLLSVFVMRNYQPGKNKTYYLPQNVYNWYLFVVQDIGAYFAGLYEDPKQRPEQKYITAVQKALALIPEEYRFIVFDNLAFGTPIPKAQRGKTTTVLKAQFVYTIALLISPYMPGIIV